MSKKAPQSLLDATQRLLRETDVPLPVIYRDTNLSFYWLRAFYDGRIKDPSVTRIQTLYEYLSGRKLEV